MATRNTRTYRRHAVAGTALLAPLILLPLSAATAAPERLSATGPPTKMEIKNFLFGMPNLEVAVGDSVTWTNLDKAPHDATTSDSPVEFVSPTLLTGESWTYTFQTPGKYDYYCSIHPQMVASIVAAPGAHDGEHAAATAKTAKRSKVSDATDVPTAKRSATPGELSSTAAVVERTTTPAPTAEQAKTARTPRKAAALESAPALGSAPALEGAPAVASAAVPVGTGAPVEGGTSALDASPVAAGDVSRAVFVQDGSGVGAAMLALALAVVTGVLLLVSYGAGVRRGTRPGG